MNVEKSFFNFGNKIQPKDVQKETPCFEEVQKQAVERLLSRSEREVCEWGSFSDVIEEYKNPENNDTYTLFVTPSPDSKKPQMRILQMAIHVPLSGRMFSCDLKRGTKDEILGFLSDKENLKEISGYAKMLSNRLDKE
ncbi:TPA: hypothetical protein IAA68_03930 [Candidatus Galligastranaerophilus faecipullorum]|nr:hypothetical protein [Candidatus Galligastranaerophilus faecipullorum]